MMTRVQRILSNSLSIFCTIASSYAYAVEEEVKPEPSLQPRPKMVMFEPGFNDSEGKAGTDVKDNVDLEALSDDIAKMRLAAEQIRSSLRQNAIKGLETAADELSRPIVEDEESQERQPLGRARPSTRLGNNELSVQLYRAVAQGLEAEKEVTARIQRESVRMVYVELVYLLDIKMADTGVSQPNRQVNVHFENLPWREALTRILGQAGLDWRETGEGENYLIEIFDRRDEPLRREQLEKLAEHSFGQAADQQTNHVAAEAMYLRGERELAMGYHRSAIMTYLDVLERFAPKAEKDQRIKKWMHKALLGLADTFVERELYLEARTQFLNYISIADGDDPVLPAVYRKAAYSSRKLGDRDKDQAAYRKAMEILDLMLNKYGADTENADVIQAQWMLGDLLFRRGEYMAAKKQLETYYAYNPEARADTLRFYLAECDYHLAVTARRAYDHARADRYLEKASSYYKELVEAFTRNDKDETADESIYSQSFYQRGMCFLQQREPDFTNALYSFLEAQRMFPNSRISAAMMVHIAHCYAELESDEFAIAQLYKLIDEMDVNVADQAEAALEIESLMTDIEGSLREYDSPIKAKVLFYIGQAHYQAARRMRMDPARLDKAKRAYVRVLEEGKPDRYLEVSAKIGLARALFALNDDTRAEQNLIELLRRNDLPGRDRHYVAQLLGRYYQENKRYQDAIQAYGGTLTE